MELESIILSSVRIVSALSMILFLVFAIQKKPKAWMFLFTCFLLKSVLHFYLKLPTSGGAQFIFSLMSLHGYFVWKKDNNSSAVVQSWPLPMHFILNGLGLVILGALIISYTKSSNPLIYLETIIATYIIFGIYTLSHKLLGSWVYWCISFLCMIVYFGKMHMLFNISISTVFLLLSIFAYYKWDYTTAKKY